MVLPGLVEVLVLLAFGFLGPCAAALYLALVAKPRS